MKIIFTKHALNKFAVFQERGLKFSRKQIENTVKLPENIDTLSDSPKIIASGKLDAEHIMRVVYLREDDIIRIITFYPAEKGRYYEI